MPKKKYSIFSCSFWEWKVIDTPGNLAFSVILGLETKAMLYLRRKGLCEFLWIFLWTSHRYFVFAFVFLQLAVLIDILDRNNVDEIHNFKLRRLCGKPD
jgi:hypothetical protein